jgi:Na+-transporting methylmalonyl-CoA/oxaloacetate decarboxylase gamma subunit
MEKLKRIGKILIILTILAIWVLLFGACASRKVHKTEVKEQVTVQVTEQVKNDITTSKESNILVNSEENEIEVTPIDTAKVIVINGTSYKNAKVRLIKRKLQSTILEKETVKDLTKTDTRVNISSKTATRVKNTEKRPSPFAWLHWLWIPCIGYLIWKYKYKIFGLWM